MPKHIRVKQQLVRTLRAKEDWEKAEMRARRYITIRRAYVKYEREFNKLKRMKA